LSELPFLAGEQGRGSFLVLLFFVSAAVVMVWGIWESTLPHSEEAVRAEMAREIAETGEGWTVRLDGDPVYDTPPLPLWVTALLIRLIGANELAARLGFVAFAVITVWIVYCCGMRTELWGSGGSGGILSGSAIGLLSAIILASSPLFAKYAPHLEPGIPLACFVTTALLGWWYLPARRSGYLLWGIGIAGGLLSAGAAGLLVVPASLVSLATDRRRRAVWRSAGFIAVTAAALALGGYWPLRAALHDAGGFGASPLWRAILGFSEPVPRSAVAMLHTLKNLFVGNLPWSIPAAVAVVRILLMRRNRERYGYSAADDTLLVFAVVLLVPVVFSRPGGMGAYLGLLPLAAILSAREVTRWLMPVHLHIHGDAAAGEKAGAPREFTASRIWSFNQVLVALFCLLMLLLVATPLRLHRTVNDPIKEVAVMAGSLVPEGRELGNLGQHRRFQGARLLFYGGRSLGPVMTTSGEVAASLREHPDRVILGDSNGLQELAASGAAPGELRVLYRAGDLLLFGMKDELPAEGAPERSPEGAPEDGE
jgi:4-amino-4-deoxy-L-arabinose transferase-like glycosyltransferase